MKNRNIFTSSYAQMIYGVTIFLSMATSQASLPQPGEDLWNVCAQIGTDVDELLTCCSTTFTAIAAAANPCALTPITGSTIISTSGSYCLATDVTSITINVSNVMLDLNGHNGGTVLLGQSASVSNAIIQNGYCGSMSDSVSFPAAFVLIQNVKAYGSTIGFSFSGSHNLLENCSSGNNITGFSITGVGNQLANCSSFSSTIGVGIGGFVIGGTDNQLGNCSSTNGATGFSISGVTHQLENCSSKGGGSGFVVSSSGAQQITIERCIASAYTTTGFNLSTAGPSCAVIECTANGGTMGTTGFIGSSTPTNAVFYLNRASKNVTNNYSGLGANSAKVTVVNSADAPAPSYGDNLSAN